MTTQAPFAPNEILAFIANPPLPLDEAILAAPITMWRVDDDDDLHVSNRCLRIPTPHLARPVSTTLLNALQRECCTFCSLGGPMSPPEEYIDVVAVQAQGLEQVRDRLDRVGGEPLLRHQARELSQLASEISYLRQRLERRRTILGSTAEVIEAEIDKLSADAAQVRAALDPSAVVRTMKLAAISANLNVTFGDPFLAVFDVMAKDPQLSFAEATVLSGHDVAGLGDVPTRADAALADDTQMVVMVTNRYSEKLYGSMYEWWFSITAPGATPGLAVAPRAVTDWMVRDGSAQTILGELLPEDDDMLAAVVALAADGLPPENLMDVARSLVT